MKTAILFGGSGYIGQFLLKDLMAKQVFEQFIIFDLKDFNRDDQILHSNKLHFIQGDVRQPIQLDEFNFSSDSWIFNLAAIHREPGHEEHEYFETNLKGAQHVNDFAEQHQINNIFFTSSIAPYGKSREKKVEDSPLNPVTPYGISKAKAEKIHQEWLANNKNRRLIIARPSVIYGPGDPGNVYRMIKTLSKGTFIIPGKGDIIKAYGYIYGLIDSINFTMHQNKPLIIYNYTENNLLTLNEMTVEVKKFMQIKKPTISLPIPILVLIASMIQLLSKVLGKTTDIHPVRVKKAGFPTHIEPAYLKENNFQFNYEFADSLKHWKSVKASDFHL